MASVDVIIPVYNGGPRVREAVESVLDQTYDDLSVLLVADGGGDDLSWTADLDPRLRLHRQANAGVSAARNTGFAMTRAPLVAYLDQDDRWMPRKLERQLDILDEWAAWSTTDFTWCLPGDERLDGHHGPLTRLDLLAGAHFCLSTLLVRRAVVEKVGGFDLSLALHQDWELALRLADEGTASHCAEALVEYNVHEANASWDHRRGYTERTSVMRSAPRNAAERQAARAGLRDSRRLYGNKAWAAFAAQRRPGDAARAVAWAPDAVARGLVAAARNRLPGQPKASS